MPTGIAFVKISIDYVGSVIVIVNGPHSLSSNSDSSISLALAFFLNMVVLVSHIF